MIIALASVVGARYLAIGAGDTELYIFAGMLAAVVISIRVFLFRGRARRISADHCLVKTIEIQVISIEKPLRRFYGGDYDGAHSGG